jgi:hypothetical protein
MREARAAGRDLAVGLLLRIPMTVAAAPTKGLFVRKLNDVTGDEHLDVTG